MSKEYPCIYYGNKGICNLHTKMNVENHCDILSYCILGPCVDQKLSNADCIRAMSDEELAYLLAHETYRMAAPVFEHIGVGLTEEFVFSLRLKWLQQPADTEE